MGGLLQATRSVKTLLPSSRHLANDGITSAGLRPPPSLLRPKNTTSSCASLPHLDAGRTVESDGHLPATLLSGGGNRTLIIGAAAALIIGAAAALIIGAAAAAAASVAAAVVAAAFHCATNNGVEVGAADAVVGEFVNQDCHVLRLKSRAFRANERKTCGRRFGARAFGIGGGILMS